MKISNNKKKTEDKLGEIGISEVAFILGYVIVIPLVGAVVLGRWLDNRFNSEPFLLLLLVLLAIIFSSIFLVVKLRKYFE
ncbi:MAG: AtpZ/AtpI family protein [Patescibacteria group bacterium]|nr:AtpZ/AtpI family protein [Patescibacteria group bacterium]